jgi:competence ComEA-like helix-hairpin-helix protein
VRQNLPTSEVAKGYLIWLLTGLLLFNSACATLSREVSSQTQSPADVLRQETIKRININTAPVEELETLPGVGRVIAQRIIEHRTKHGRFRRVEHLMMVRGISEGKFVKLRLMITVE